MSKQKKGVRADAASTSATTRKQSAPVAVPKTKLARLEAMLRWPDGATVEQISKSLAWQTHSVRGAMSGALKKKQGRKWFVRAPMVPERWFPQEHLDAESFAMSVLYGRQSDNAFPRKIGAEAWFDRRETERYEVLEQSVRIGEGEVLSLIVLTDAGMLDDEENWSYRRK